MHTGVFLDQRFALGDRSSVGDASGAQKKRKVARKESAQLRNTSRTSRRAWTWTWTREREDELSCAQRSWFRWFPHTKIHV